MCIRDRCPAYYLARNGRGSRKNTVDTSRPYDWYGFTVSSMLTKPEYMLSLIHI